MSVSYQLGMLKIIFNTILGLILIFVWSRFVNISEIIQTISKASPIYLIPVFIFMFLSPAIRALRLKIFLSEIKKISYKDLVFLSGIAMMLNFFIPIRAGEIAKGVYLNTNYNLPLGKSVIWIFLDRFVDFLVVLALAAILILFVPTKLPGNFAVILALISITFLIITYLAIFEIGFARKLVSFLKHIFILKYIKIYFERFAEFILDAFSILRRKPKDLFLLILISILAYGADALIWYFTYLSLGAPQDFFKMYLAMLLSALTYLIPAAPGYVGSAEASGLLIFSGVFGINPNLASAMTVLFHVSIGIFVLIFGLISVYSLKIDLSVILKKAFKKD